LSPAFWHNLTEIFATNETAFQMFNTFLSRGGAVGACDSDCKNTTICDMRAFRSENNCVSLFIHFREFLTFDAVSLGVQDTPAPGFSLRRRAAIVPHDFDACEGTGLAQIFAHMAGESQSA
jgi:sphingomyelin phosphodiesterase